MQNEINLPRLSRTANRYHDRIGNDLHQFSSNLCSLPALSSQLCDVFGEHQIVCRSFHITTRWECVIECPCDLYSSGFALLIIHWLISARYPSDKFSGFAPTEYICERHPKRISTTTPAFKLSILTHKSQINSKLPDFIVGSSTRILVKMMKIAVIALALLAMGCVTCGLNTEEKVDHMYRQLQMAMSSTVVQLFTLEKFSGPYSQRVISDGNCVDMTSMWIKGHREDNPSYPWGCAPRSIQFQHGSCVELYTEKGCKGTKYLATASCCFSGAPAALYNTETNKTEIMALSTTDTNPCIKSAKACTF